MIFKMDENEENKTPIKLLKKKKKKRHTYKTKTQIQSESTEVPGMLSLEM